MSNTTRRTRGRRLVAAVTAVALSAAAALVGVSARPQAAVADGTTTPATTAAQTFGLGKGSSFTTSDQPTGTVLGYNGVPTDLGVANQHFVYYPIPSTTSTVTYNTGVLGTLSLGKYVDGDGGLIALSINSAGKVYEWGGNRFGQGGTGTPGTVSGTYIQDSPTLVSTLPSTETFVQVSAGGHHAMALTSGGDIYTWGGTNTGGDLGQGNTTTIANGQATALKVNVPGVKFKWVSAGNDYSLAVATDGSVYGWGANQYNVLPSGGGGTPVKQTGLTNINMVSAGMQHAAAVSMTGALYTWGYPARGRLGNGSTTTGGGVTQVGTGVTWAMVDAGTMSTWGVSTSGGLYAWGGNSYGQLGTGDTTDRTTPTQVGSNVKQVSGNDYSAIALGTNGTVYTTGTNDPNLQLGSGTVNTVYGGFTPIAVTGATEVAEGFDAAGAKAGSLKMWGDGYQTGISGTAMSATPVTVNGVSGTPATPYVTATTTTTLTDAQAAGSSIVFGDPTSQSQSITGWQSALNISVVTNNGTKYLRGDVPPHAAGAAPVFLKWNDGTNTWQNTGTYTYTIALKTGSSPRPAPTAQTVTVTASFSDPAEAPYAGSSVVDFSIPALGGASPALVSASGSSVSGVSLAGGTATTIVGLATPLPAANNGANAWLYPTSVTARVGSLTVSRNTPAGDVQFQSDGAVTPPPTQPVCTVAPQWLNSSKVSGTVQGYASDRTTEALQVPVPPSTSNVGQVSVGGSALKTATGSDPNNNGLATRSLAGTHALLLDKNGDVWASGNNNYGQVGDKTTVNRTTPVMVLGPDSTLTPTSSKVVQVSAGQFHSLALTADGSIYQWGSIAGLGMTGSGASSTPTKITTVAIAFKAIAAGTDSNLALSTAGKVYAWGTNDYGQMANGLQGSTRYATPTLVAGALATATVTQISMNATHVLVLTSTGAVYGWGGNAEAEIQATGGTGFVLTPTQVTGLAGKTVTQVETGELDSYALTSDGVYGWGSALDGAIGLPDSTTHQPTPALIAGTAGLGITQVFAGLDKVYATTTSGDVYAWGANHRPGDATTYPNGDLGIDRSATTAPYTATPVKVPGLSGKGVTQIAVSTVGFPVEIRTTQLTMMAVTGSGAVYGWGGNQLGALGPNAPQFSTSPALLDLGAAMASASATTSGKIYFGDPAAGSGVGKSVEVDVTASDIVTSGGAQYFLVKIPRHVVGTVQVYADWGGGVQQIGCYGYLLDLNIAPTPYPQAAGGTVTVTAYVDAGEEDLTGSALVDISIPAVGNQLELVAGQSLTGLAFTAGKATTQVTLATPWPTPTEADGDWKYPDSAVAWIPSGAGKTSLASDSGGVVVSNQATTPTPWVWFTPPAFTVHLWKTGESVAGTQVGLGGSTWAVHPDAAANPGHPDLGTTVTAFGSAVTNPNATSGDRSSGWFTGTFAPGTYWLVETKAPQGFSLMSQPLQFTVAADGTITLGAGKSAYIAVTSDWDGTNANTVTIRDPGATHLPTTGSPSWLWLTLLGLGILGAGAALVVRRKPWKVR